MKPEITQEVLDVARNVAKRLALTPTGRLAGADELYSQALVEVCEIREEYEPERGEFMPYLVTKLRYRLIDWLRVQYGRVATNRHKLVANLTMQSMEDEVKEFGRVVPRHETVQDQTPSVEEQVLARDELRRLGQNLDKLTDRRRAGLMWPLGDTPPQEIAAQLGIGLTDLEAARWAAKAVMYEALDRPKPKRVANKANDKRRCRHPPKDYGRSSNGHPLCSKSLHEMVGDNVRPYVTTKGYPRAICRKCEQQAYVERRARMASSGPKAGPAGLMTVL